MTQQYKVIETPCYPNKWKVDGVTWPTDNLLCNYFATKEAADKEALRRNSMGEQK